MPRRRRLLSLGHSYVVALNRRLAAELAREGGTDWEVAVAAPTFFHGDLRDIHLERVASGEPYELVALRAFLTRHIHVFLYEPALAGLLRRGWDLVHCWEEPFVFACAQIAALLPRSASLVFSTYQNLDKRYPPPFQQFERAVLRRSAGWIAGAETVFAALGPKRGYADRPSATIPMGVDTEIFAPSPDAARTVRTELGWDGTGPPVVGYLGRFVPEKGIGFLTDALESVRAPWRALFVGGGPREGELRAFAARHPDRVRVVTGVPHDRVPAYLNAMDVLCCPSQTTTAWREQFGRMITEAYACGVPVVGSDSGEVPHTVGDAGMVLSEHDPVAWRVALEDLLESPARRADLGARGRERAMTQFSWPVVARRHLDFFDRVLAARA